LKTVFLSASALHPELRNLAASKFVLLALGVLGKDQGVEAVTRDRAADPSPVARSGRRVVLGDAEVAGQVEFEGVLVRASRSSFGLRVVVDTYSS
jgi:hypothetical protein